MSQPEDYPLGLAYGTDLHGLLAPTEGVQEQLPGIAGSDPVRQQDECSTLAADGDGE